MDRDRVGLLSRCAESVYQTISAHYANAMPEGVSLHMNNSRAWNPKWVVVQKLYVTLRITLPDGLNSGTWTEIRAWSRLTESLSRICISHWVCLIPGGLNSGTWTEIRAWNRLTESLSRICTSHSWVPIRYSFSVNKVWSTVFVSCKEN